MAHLQCELTIDVTLITTLNVGTTPIWNIAISMTLFALCEWALEFDSTGRTQLLLWKSS